MARRKQIKGRFYTSLFVDVLDDGQVALVARSTVPHISARVYLTDVGREHLVAALAKK